MKNLLTAVATLLLGVQGAAAAIILQVDVSNPSAVVFTATGEAADLNGTLQSFAHGIRLSDFFSGAATTSWGNALEGNLTIGAAETGGVFNYFDTGANTRLNLYGYSQGGITLQFSQTAPAFVGSMVMNLSLFEGILPPVGSTGNVTGSDGATVIGQYAAIPEPSWALFGMVGLAALGALRISSRRKESSR